MPDNEFLRSGKQVEEIESELIKYKEEIEASDNYLNYMYGTCMCSGLTMKVINDVCSTLQELCSLERIMEKLEKNMRKRLYRLSVMSHPNRLNTLIISMQGFTDSSDCH